jgi:hypothetical protein
VERKVILNIQRHSPYSLEKLSKLSLDEVNRYDPGDLVCARYFTHFFGMVLFQSNSKLSVTVLWSRM